MKLNRWLLTGAAVAVVVAALLLFACRDRETAVAGPSLAIAQAPTDCALLAEGLVGESQLFVSVSDCAETEPPTPPPPEPPPPPPPAPPPPAPPPPPPSDDCDVVVVSGQNVQTAVNVENQRACLDGEFTLADGFTIQGREGVNTLLFDLTAAGAVVDGSRATIQGNFAGQDNLAVQMSGANQVLVDITIDAGFIVVGSRASNSVITRPTVRNAVAPDGNFGLIRTLGGDAGGPSNVRVFDAVLTDLFGCASSATQPCTGPTNDWQAENDREHLACFTIQGTSDVRLSGGELARCPALFYFKQFSRTQPVVIENVVGREAQVVGECRSGNKTFVNVDFGDVPQVNAPDRQCITAQ